MAGRASSRLLAPALLLAAGLAACVELDGQRISLHYDAKADVLRLLLFYDGIHDSKEEPGKCREDLGKFVAGGDLMLLDWFFHVDMAEIRANSRKEENPPALRALMACIAESVKVRALGHYRDPDGRIGAAQWVEVIRASELVKRANAAISEAVLSAKAHDAAWERTIERMRPGAREGRAWIALDGHSVSFTFPAHLPEWTRNKAGAVRDAARQAREGPGDPDADMADMGLQVLSWSPVSLVETHESVSVRLGDPARPSTFRVRMRRGAKAGLDAEVVRLVPASLDALLPQGPPAPGAAAEDAALRAILDWGPPEERARVLILRAAAATGEPRVAALAALAAWGREWDLAVGVPKAPGPAEDPAAALDAWKAWYRDLLGTKPGE